MKLERHDYLKFWRVVRYFVRAKYKLTFPEIDMLLFLYSEKYFSRGDFDEFNQLFSWDEKRFNNLLRNGWIEMFRPYDRKTNKKAVYKLSHKSNTVIRLIYNKLNGEEIPTSVSGNPMFLKKVRYTDKVYRNMVKQMNEYYRSKIGSLNKESED
jgi:hypothetical protein